MATYKVKLPKKAFNIIAGSAVLLTIGGVGSYLRHNDYINYEKPYENAEIIEKDFHSGIGWRNYMNEPLTHTTDGWHQYMIKSKEINGKKLTEFKMGEKIKLFDIEDPKTGKPDGKALPGD